MTKFKCPACGADLRPGDAAPLAKVVCPRCRASAEVPATFGAYLLKSKLGVGATGAVFQAFDSVLRRDVALKILKPVKERAALVERWIQEAQILASLDHPGICKLYKIGERRGLHFIEMELLTGGSLRQWLTPKNQPTQLQLVEMALAIAGGLREAANVGLLHLDVKPVNILLDDHGQAKLIDFGAGQVAPSFGSGDPLWGSGVGAALGADGMAASGNGSSMGSSAGSSAGSAAGSSSVKGVSKMDQSGRRRAMFDSTAGRSGEPRHTIGTAEYIAPEVVRKRPPDFRADMYSLGATLFHLATGRPPYVGATAKEIVLQRLDHSAPRPSRFRPDLHPLLEVVIRTCLRREPENRYASYDDLILALEEARRSIVNIEATGLDDTAMAALALTIDGKWQSPSGSRLGNAKEILGDLPLDATADAHNAPLEAPDDGSAIWSKPLPEALTQSTASKATKPRASIAPWVLVCGLFLALGVTLGVLLVAYLSS